MNNTKKSRNEIKKRLENTMAFFVAVIFAICVVNFIITPTKVYAIKERTQTEKTIEEIVSELNSEMDISSTSGISKKDFIYALKNCEYDKNGVLRKNAEIIWLNCQKYQLNEFAFCGIIAFESGWCDSDLTKNKKNIMSIKNSKGEYNSYYSYAKCIEEGAKLLRKKYIDEDSTYDTGGKLPDIAYTYVGDEVYINQWCEGIADCATLCSKALS